MLIDDDMSKEMSTKIAPIAILLERSDNDFYIYGIKAISKTRKAVYL